MALALKNQSDEQQNNCLNLSKTTPEEPIYEYTNTTATLTPTRLKSIEEQFFDRSLVPPPGQQFVHERMAGFRIPSQVNIQSMIKSFSHFLVEKPPTSSVSSSISSISSISSLSSTLSSTLSSPLFSSTSSPLSSNFPPLPSNFPALSSPNSPFASSFPTTQNPDQSQLYHSLQNQLRPEQIKANQQAIINKLLPSEVPSLIPPQAFYKLAPYSKIFLPNLSETESSNSSTHSTQMATEPAGSNDFSTASKRNASQMVKKNDRRISKVEHRTPEIASSSRSNSPAAKRANSGGRKPKNDQVSPEEELKRQKRRERNKIAAARCRKKRVDQTQDLEGTKNELLAKHQSLCERMRELMATYCSQESRVNDHLSGQCKNNDALNSSLPLLTSGDYQEIVNNMFVEQKDDTNSHDDASSSKESETNNRENNYQISRAVIAVPVTATGNDPNSPTTYKQIPLTTVIIPVSSSAINIATSNAKSRSVTVIPTPGFESTGHAVIQNSSVSGASAANSSSVISTHSKRPNTLILTSKVVPSSTSSSSTAVSAAGTSTENSVSGGGSSALQTPSSGFVFDSALEGSGTGLTPLASSTFAFLRSITTPLTDTPEGKTFTSM